MSDKGVDPGGGVVNKKPLLKKLLRNWAKGARLAFLEGFIADYKEALVSKTKASSVLDAIVNQWFTRFHWTIPLSSEDSATGTVVPVDALGHEVLSPADSILKGRVIERARTSLYHWYEYRCKRTTAPRLGKGKKDPISLLIEKVLGRTTSPTRRSAGWEAWGKENFSSFKEEFEADFAASGKPKSARAAARNDFKLARWKELDDETQAHWNDVAKTKYEEAKKDAQERANSSGLLSPAEAQALLNDLPSVLGPLVQSIGEALGMHVTVLIGGPEPSKKGQLNMIGIHHGENKAAVPKVWPLAEKEKFAVVKEAFISFLGTCYSIDEQRARALHQAPTQTDAQPSSSTPAPGPSAETLTQPSNSSTAAGEGRKRKRDTDTKDQKSRRKAKKGKEPQKRPNKRRKATIISDAEDSATSDDSEPSDDEGINDEEEEEGEEEGENNDDDEDENGDEDEDEDEDEDGVTINRRTSMDPKRWKRGKAPVKVSINRSNVNVKNDVPAPHQSVSPSPARLSPSLPTAPLIAAPLGPPPPPPSPPPPPPRSDTPLGETDSQCHGAASLINQPVPSSATTSEPNAAWPSWFRDAYTLLSSRNLGTEFAALIEQFVQLEERKDFAPGARSDGFKSDNRPPEVRYWISRGRATEPKISAVKDFEESWWKWWTGLQPAWRAALEVDGVLDSVHHPTLTGNEDWSAVDKCGKNAFFSVMATLLWWGAALPGPANGDPHWLAAVRDVGWVLSGLCTSQAASQAVDSSQAANLSQASRSSQAAPRKASKKHRR